MMLIAEEKLKKYKKGEIDEETKSSYFNLIF